MWKESGIVSKLVDGLIQQYWAEDSIHKVVGAMLDRSAELTPNARSKEYMRPCAVTIEVRARLSP